MFTTAPQGSFYLAIRGTHNFAGTVDMGALSGRAKPSDPLDSSLTTIPQATLTRGLKKPFAATSSMWRWSTIRVQPRSPRASPPT